MRVSTVLEPEDTPEYVVSEITEFHKFKFRRLMKSATVSGYIVNMLT